MLLFSKRNKTETERYIVTGNDEMDEVRRKRYEQLYRRRQNPLSQQARVRLRKQAVLIIESGNYIEPFLLVKDTAYDAFRLNEDSLKELSLSELGYDLTSIIDCRTLQFTKEYTDYLFFDLLEILIIFAKDSEREALVKRLQDIFDEEGNQFLIHDFMITKRGSGLTAVVPILQDKSLQSLLEDYSSADNHIDQARISAGIIQRLFSPEDTSKDTKVYSEELCGLVASKWTDKANIDSLKRLLSETVKNAKSLDNQISNIRHTDKFSIPVEGPSMYRLIAKNNMAIAELVILSLQDKFVIKQKAEDLKKTYLDKYSVDKSKLIEVDSSISLEDIPF